MKASVVTLLLTFSFLPLVLAQKFHPVKWEFSAQHIEGNEYRLLFKASISAGWYIYSQYLEGDTGPIPTSLFFDPSDAYTLKGKASENGHRKEGFDPIFEMKVIKLFGEIVLIQKVAFHDQPTEVKGFLEYMTCNEETCLPPREVPFLFEF